MSLSEHARAYSFVGSKCTYRLLRQTALWSYLRVCMSVSRLNRHVTPAHRPSDILVHLPQQQLHPSYRSCVEDGTCLGSPPTDFPFIGSNIWTVWSHDRVTFCAHKN